MTEQLLDVCDVAALLGLGVRTVWKHHDSGLLPRAVRIGGCVRWRRADIDKWINAGCPDCRKLR